MMLPLQLKGRLSVKPDEKDSAHVATMQKTEALQLPVPR